MFQFRKKKEKRICLRDILIYYYVDFKESLGRVSGAGLSRREIMGNKTFLRYVRKMKDPRQEVIADIGAFSKLADKLIEDGIKRIFLISGQQTKKLKLYDDFIARLTEAGVRCFIFSDVGKTPDARVIERCTAQCQTYNCDIIIAFGGGTVIDVAKLVSVWVTNPTRSLYQLRGFGKIPNPGVDLYAVPTTGSGAESTGCALIHYEQQICTYFSNYMIPAKVILDPDLTLRLPAEVFASASMLALTHAIEAYISANRIEFPADGANVLIAVPIFFSYMEKCYKHGANADTYLQMMMAPYYSGIACRKIGFGYAHCLGIRIAEKYGLNPGRVSATVLPYILESALDQIVEPLAELALTCHLCSGRADKLDAAKALIEGLKSLNRRVDIPSTIPNLRLEDFNDIIEMVMLDARNWGTPIRMTARTIQMILRKLK